MFFLKTDWDEIGVGPVVDLYWKQKDERFVIKSKGFQALALIQLLILMPKLGKMSADL